MSKIKILGLIPARGGSKGLPKKNLYLFNKKPLIQWTIESALESNSLDRIIVNTDDESIADFSRSKGVEVPFLREPHLAQDDSRIVDAVLNVLEKIINFDFILLLQPTSPLRTKEDITNIIKLQKQYNASSLVSVCEAKENPALFYEINNDNYLSKSFKQYKGSNRQEYKRNYIINGALYFSSVENLKKNKSFITNKTIPYVMPRERSIDIDDITDIRWGEFIQKYKN
tara:strand:- start:1171 stop:1854 length:684 start_codon:yes stop_codon:yes gene_type:complete